MDWCTKVNRGNDVRSKRPKVLHLLNAMGTDPGPSGRAAHISNETFEVVLCSYYSVRPDIIANRQAYGKRVEALDAKGRLDLLAWLRLYRLLRRGQFDVVHTHHNLSGILGRVLGKIAGVPIIVNSNGTVHTRFPIPVRVAKGLTLPLADAHVFVSRAVERSFSWWEKLLCARRKRIVIYNGVDIRAIDQAASEAKKTRKQLGLAEDAFVVGHVGRLIPLKNQTTLLKAFAVIGREHAEARLIIVGQGPMANDLKSDARALNIHDKTVFTGFVSLEETYAIFNLIDVFAMTSFAEGFSKVVLEAMAARKPVVATDIMAFREAVIDGVTGRIVPLQDPESLANALLSLCEDPKTARAMGAAGRQRVEENFLIEKTASEYENLYWELLEQRGMV